MSLRQRKKLAGVNKKDKEEIDEQEEEKDDTQEKHRFLPTQIINRKRQTNKINFNGDPHNILQQMSKLDKTSAPQVTMIHVPSQKHSHNSKQHHPIINTTTNNSFDQFNQLYFKSQLDTSPLSLTLYNVVSTVANIFSTVDKTTTSQAAVKLKTH